MEKILDTPEKIYDRAEMIQSNFHDSMEKLSENAKRKNINQIGDTSYFNVCLYTKIAQLEIKIEELTDKINY